MTRSVVPSLAGGLLLAGLLLPAPALAQQARADFHEAYYLEHERADLEGALALYRKVADSRRADDELRAQAERAARGIAEELASSDLARLVPSDTIVYLELEHPGEQVSRLLGELGLLGRAHEVVPEGLAVSPLLIQHALGVRGAAVAITRIVPGGEPDGVLVLDPGHHQGLRGLIDTALPAAGLPADAIDGFPSWSLEDGVQVCLTERLVLVSKDPRQIAGVVGRLHGGGKDSLADNPAFAHAMDGGRNGLLRFFVNAEPLKPLMRQAIQQQAQRDPGAAMAASLLDLDSLVGLSGRLGVDEQGIGLELALDLAEGHHNLVFDLLRRPAVGRETLELVPEGAAFFVASALNPRADVAPITTDPGGRPVVSLLDFGREAFGNVIDAALVGMPPDPDAGPGLPDVALVMRVNDVARSRALWDLLLTTASQAAGAPPAGERVGDVEATRFALQGFPVYLASTDGRLVVALQRDAVERALEPAARTIARDPVFDHALESLEASPTMLIAACPGRCAEMALPFAPRGERDQLVPIVDMLGRTALSLVVEHSGTRLAVRARLRELPDVSALVDQALLQRKHAAGAGAPQPRPALAAPARPAASAEAVEASAKVEAPSAAARPSGSATAPQPAMLRKNLDARVAAGDLDGARRVGDRIAATVQDAGWLNDFAWALLTDDAYGGRLDDVALVVSRRSCELSDPPSWYQLDTQALAEFRCGNVRQAVELQARAVKSAEDDPRQGEAVKRLQQYTKALRESGPIVQATAGDAGG